jgi:hypothetical protein
MEEKIGVPMMHGMKMKDEEQLMNKLDLGWTETHRQQHIPSRYIWPKYQEHEQKWKQI